MPPHTEKCGSFTTAAPYTDRTGMNLEQPIYKLFLLMYTVCT